MCMCGHMYTHASPGWSPTHLPTCPGDSVWTGEAGRRGLWLAGVEPSPSLSVFLPHHSIDPPHSFCSCSVAVSTSPLGPFLCFLKGTWSFCSPCGIPRSPSSPLLTFPPAGQGSTLSRSPEQRLVTVSTAPFCLVGGDFCPMNHLHPPLKGGLERGYWCFPVHRLLWGPLNLCCRPFHPGDTLSGLGPVEDPTQLHYSASFSVGLLIHFPKSGRAPWPPSVSPGSRPREPRGPTLPGAGGALAVSYGDAGRTHQDAATQGAILLELCFSPSFLGECWVGCGRAGSGG